MATIRRLSELRRAYKAGVAAAHAGDVPKDVTVIAALVGEPYVEDFTRGAHDTEQLIDLGIIARGEQK
jgi:hypothetical protein